MKKEETKDEEALFSKEDEEGLKQQLEDLGYT